MSDQVRDPAAERLVIRPRGVGVLVFAPVMVGLLASSIGAAIARLQQGQ